MKRRAIEKKHLDWVSEQGYDGVELVIYTTPYERKNRLNFGMGTMTFCGVDPFRCAHEIFLEYCGKYAYVELRGTVEGEKSVQLSSGKDWRFIDTIKRIPLFVGGTDEDVCKEGEFIDWENEEGSVEAWEKQNAGEQEPQKEPKQNGRFILLCANEQEIGSPTFFDTLEKAQNRMKYFFDLAVEFEEDEAGNEISDFCAKVVEENGFLQIYDLEEQDHEGRFVLVEYSNEKGISQPLFFEDFKEAQTKMKERFLKVSGLEDIKDASGGNCFMESMAFYEGDNSGNYAWEIFDLDKSISDVK